MAKREPEIFAKYRKQLKSIFDNNYQNISTDMLEEFERFMRDNWSADTIKIYRYSGADYHNIRNFETGKIRLAPNGALNDIFEGLPQGVTDEQVSALNDLVYMKCFSTDYNNTLMWSHYADENRGICVEYDLSILEQSDPISKHIYPVIYSKERPFKSDIEYISEIVESQKWLNHDIGENGISNYDDLLQLLPLFLFKNSDWEYENEWRIIYSKADLYLENYTNFSNILINFDCATGIYLGYRTDPEIKKHIYEIVDRVNCQRIENSRDCISVYEAKLCSDKYGFTFTKSKS